ncbi:hypothetical protein BOX15_Mlig020110g4, partial [Macrostomum lignano]
TKNSKTAKNCTVKMKTATVSLLLCFGLLLSVLPEPSFQLSLEDDNVPACFHPVLLCKIKGSSFTYTNICGKECKCNRAEASICDPGCNDDVKTWFQGLSSYSAYFRRCKDLRLDLKIDYE